MPDQGAPVSIIQNSFASGELSPRLYGRQDLQKYHGGAALMRNWYVDYKGGATTRPGTQFIGRPSSNGFTRLIPFQFSPTVGQTYILVFSDQKLRFIKNPGGNIYPNSSNAAFIESSPGVIYEISTPYLEADLRNIHFLQIADEMWLTVHGYARMKLKRLGDTNWTLSSISTSQSIVPPQLNSITISANPAGSTDPSDTRYMYCVSSVDKDGIESIPSAPIISATGINIATTQGTVSIFWSPATNAVFYKVYKALPTPGDKIPNPSEQFGFAGFSYGTSFTDSNIIADFTQAPLRDNDPFISAGIIGFAISASSSDWPVATTTLTVADGGAGTGAVAYPIFSTNTAAANGAITGIYFAQPGHGYTSPTISAAGGGTTFTATLTAGPSSGIEPSVVGLVGQRLVYASTDNKPNTIFGGRPGAEDDFRSSNPVIDSDAFEFAVFNQQVNTINWLKAMPGGLVVGTNSGIVQLTGGSSSPSNPTAITPTNAVIVPQSSYGTKDIAPIVIDYDILFVTPSGLVIDLQYNFFVNIFTGNDITILSSHMFETAQILDWAYQDTPRKIAWAVRDDGALLSLTYLKAQEVMGWAVHETIDGQYESIASVQEGNEVAVYVTVKRSGQASRFVERLCGSVWGQASAAWQVDCALSTTLTYPAATLTPAAITGTNVLFTASATTFTPGDVGKLIYTFSGKGRIISYTSTTVVHVDIINPFPGYATTQPVALASGQWHFDANVAVVNGLGHLEGKSVVALVDGTPQGPFTVTGGSITLSAGGSMVVVGRQFLCSLQPLYLDVGGETTLQGRRKKIVAASVRVAPAAGLKYGIDFENLTLWTAGQTSTDPKLELPYSPNDLYEGDQRIVLDQYFTVGGWVCVRQDLPLPATIVSIEPEFAQGDTR